MVSAVISPRWIPPTTDAKSAQARSAQALLPPQWPRAKTPAAATSLRVLPADDSSAARNLRLEQCIAARTGGRVQDLHVTQSVEQVTVCGSAASYHIQQLVLAAVRAETNGWGPERPSVKLEMEVHPRE